MLEIIAMFSLGSTIRNIALDKGLKPGPFIVMMIMYWIGLEFTGAYIGMQITTSMAGAYFCGLAGAAFGGYLGYQRVLKAESID
ncbi:hypothetical protein [Marinoscillum sp. MHG1-6]|uniref:hypothetical protein n=1 Tax=Marinoscillum sp. MHG1-6 TaxID=2959627 RepID=UPI002157C1C3|nr:hypothetical protein [Marinoscillum sp. MHG1-6]